MRKTLILLSLLLVFVACTAEDCNSDPSPVATEQTRKKLQSTENLMQNQPGHEISFSMDRHLINERNTRLNDPNKMSYLYIVLLDGTWLKVTIVGKLTSTSKRLTRKEQLFWFPYSGNSSSSQGSYQLSEAPDEMGVWGQSDPAKVGLTTLGSLIEFGGMVSYIYSETPLNFAGMNKPVIEMTIQASEEEKTKMLGDLNDLKQKYKSTSQPAK